MEGLDVVSLRIGFCLGLLLPFGVFVVRWVWGKIKTPFKPMAVVQTTKKTPFQVLAEAFDALVLLVVVIAGLAIAVSARPDLISTLRGIVSRLVGP